ncbi:MAG: hypothetical protein FD124_2283 [Alphaproteobacteria bacterium]|nr:MAG: hypothetical protein FD160_3659 [Caulobacteraceae bacterium]TPW05174.1 MAG: hypothetical protein FD124_2283 [Alphaproteobacteria bacterium]
MARRNPEWEQTPLARMAIWIVAPALLVLILGLFFRH